MRLLLVLFACTAFAAEQPNVVVILADDYGYGSAGCFGADPKLVRTPAIDRLAAEGRRFTDANTTSSVCSPTRYSVLTGRYCWRTTLTHEVLGTFSPLHIETTRLNMASLLKKHGYNTASVGKWHLGYGTEDESPKWRTDYTAELSPGPLDIGFDYHFSVPSNHGDLTGIFVENRFVYGLRAGKIPAGMKVAGPAADSDDYQATYGPEDTENGKNGPRILELDAPRRKNQRVMKVLTDKATTWLEAQPKDKPFFLYFTPVAVHNPVTPDKDLAGKSAAGLYGDWIHELDRSVERILATLDKMGVTKNTLVIFASDNGGVFHPEKDSVQTAAFKAGLKVNGDLRGGKHDVWEGGFKIPFIARWPGKVAAGSTSKEMISVVDILSTTAAIVGEPLPAVTVGAEDSRSFLPLLLGEAQAKGRTDMIVHSADGNFAVRQGPWKWIEGIPVDEIKAGVRKARKDEFHPQLYNTQEDPGETKDVSAAHPEIVVELKALLNRYRNGGYSRELPPADAKPVNKKIAVLTPIMAGTIALDEPLAKVPGKPWVASAGEWSAHDGGVFAKPKSGSEKAAALRTPLALSDGSVECELNLKGANRISLRFGAGDAGFRLVVSRTTAILTKNPNKGEAATATEDIAKKNLKLAAGEWYPVRLTFKGDEVTVQVNDQTFKGKHPSLGKDKTSLDFLVFGDSAGFRNVRVAK
ncbi:MAG: hypothetical protein EBQ59_09830 [Verrucomicrobia bacterium]|nr:hypothetical protein [Verrucomicrobiota bacterium]